MTLEDETGNTNVIIWPDLAQRQRRELLSATLLAVYGIVQRQGNCHPPAGPGDWSISATGWGAKPSQPGFPLENTDWFGGRAHPAIDNKSYR